MRHRAPRTATPLVAPLLALAATLAGPAAAADVALLIDTGSDGAPGEDAAFVAEALAAQGYEVYEPAAPGRPGLRDAVAGFAGRLGEAERALVVLAGPTFAEGGRSWLLPAGFAGEGAVDAAFDGLPLALFLDLAAARPGRSAVVLAHEAGEGAPPEVAEAPQGVLVLVGPRDAALAAVTDRLLAADTPAAEAVDGLEGVEVAGFASPDAGFAGTPDPDAEPAPRPAEPTPEERAEAAEAALGLDQAARRRIQEDLTVLGYNTRGIDGIFGPGTRRAIAEWQTAQGFAATGYLASEEVARIRERAAARSAELAAEAERQRAAEEAADAEFWRTTGAGGTAADLRTYLDRYPDGVYAGEARRRLEALEAEARDAAAAEDRAAWDEARTRNTVAAYRRYLEARPDGAFAEPARARIAALQDAPREEAAREEARAREEALGLNQASRALIEGQLAALGYEVGEQDGRFDQASRRAIRQFQTRQGLPVTGFVDQETVQALIVASLGLR